MLWTAVVKPAKPVHCRNIENPVRLANVALINAGPFQTHSSLMICHGGRDYLLCTLSLSTRSQAMDLLFDDEDEVTFKVMDGGTFHLVGFEEPDDYDDSDDEEDDESSVSGDEATPGSPIGRSLKSSTAAMGRLAVGSRRSRLDTYMLARRKQ